MQLASGMTVATVSDVGRRMRRNESRMVALTRQVLCDRGIKREG